MTKKSAIIIGRYIKKIRIQQGLSIDALANKTDISASQISVIERGKNKINGKYINITLTSLEMITMGLGLTVQQILEESGYYDFINDYLIRYKKNEQVTIEDEILQYYEDLNFENKQAVNEFIYQLFNKQNIDKPNTVQLVDDTMDVKDESSCS